MEIKVPNSLDPNHKYVFRSSEFGAWFQYWYKDRVGNYYLYTNAPEDSEDHDVFGGEPLLVPDQLFMHEYPQFFTAEGYRRHMAPTEGAIVLKNEEYNKLELANSWYEYYLADTGDIKYIYLDSDIKENPNLYVQYQIRLVDAGLTKYRKFAAEKFQSESSNRDKVIGCILLLVDQGLFQLNDLINANVADISFIDETVYLLGRKVKVDIAVYDFLTSIVAGRPITEPLFAQNSIAGSNVRFGMRELCATFAYLKVSPNFLQYWHATHIFSRIVNKHKVLGTPFEKVEGLALEELSKVFNTNSDIKYLIDFQVSSSLFRKYAAVDASQVVKSMAPIQADTFGVAQVFSDLIERRGDELAFSQWLHAQPLHYSYENEGSAKEAELKQGIEDTRLENAKRAGLEGAEDFQDSNLDGEADLATDLDTNEPPETVPEELQGEFND